jgi:hypothetical protein
LRADRQRKAGCLATLAVLAALLMLYGGAYFWARASHRLVRSSGDSIHGNRALEAVFAPVIFAEGTFRWLFMPDPGV